MITIGITGGVGSGKTSVLQFLERKINCKIILADEVANELKKPGRSCFFPIVDLLGKDILGPDGFIDKGKMAEVIFQNNGLLSKVNMIIRPAVMKEILYKKKLFEKEERTKVLFIEAALLIEAGYKEYIDELWYIYSDDETRFQRLMEGREYTREKTESIMKYQLSEKEFRNEADVVINNSASFEYTCEQLEKECLRLGLWQNE